jgi:hypothetical protein
MPKPIPFQLPSTCDGRPDLRSEPPAAVIAPAGLIPQMAPLAYEQIIIAGSDEDVTAEELFDWVAPLLAGIPGGRWMSCQLDLAVPGRVTAQYRSGASDTAVCVALDAATPMMREFLEQLPRAESVTMILLSDCSSQAVTLLDCVARWLNIYDIDEASLAPVVRLLGGFQGLLAKAG